MSEQLERNKRNVIEFYDLMFNRCQPAEALEKYTGDVYIQHNPGSVMVRKHSSSTSRRWRGSIPANASTSSA